MSSHFSYLFHNDTYLIVGPSDWHYSQGDVVWAEVKDGERAQTLVRVMSKAYQENLDRYRKSLSLDE